MKSSAYAYIFCIFAITKTFAELPQEKILPVNQEANPTLNITTQEKESIVNKLVETKAITKEDAQELVSSKGFWKESLDTVGIIALCMVIETLYQVGKNAYYKRNHESSAPIEWQESLNAGEIGGSIGMGITMGLYNGIILSCASKIGSLPNVHAKDVITPLVLATLVRTIYMAGNKANLNAVGECISRGLDHTIETIYEHQIHEARFGINPHPTLTQINGDLENLRSIFSHPISRGTLRRLYFEGIDLLNNQTTLQVIVLAWLIYKRGLLAMQQAKLQASH